MCSAHGYVVLEASVSMFHRSIENISVLTFAPKTASPSAYEGITAARPCILRNASAIERGFYFILAGTLVLSETWASDLSVAPGGFIVIVLFFVFVTVSDVGPLT